MNSLPDCYRCGAQPCRCEDGITLYCADSREVLPLLGAGSVDLVLADPPYGINHPTDYRGRGMAAAGRDYPRVTGDDQPFDPSWVLAPGWPAIMWGGNHYASRLPDSSGWLVWDKERPDDLDQATCELAWTNAVKGVRRIRYLWHGMIRAGSDTLWHPTQKPVEVMRWCLMTRWTKEARLILDPFAGSGTTGVAARDLGRRCILIEIEEKYCQIAANRLKQKVMRFAAD
jgi:site-specific DNA-methyltransferase (adenine-specific)/modification methylase